MVTVLRGLSIYWLRFPDELDAVCQVERLALKRRQEQDEA